MKDKVKNVCKDLLSDKIFSNILTTLENVVVVRENGFEKVIMSDSRLNVRTPITKIV